MEMDQALPPHGRYRHHRGRMPAERQRSSAQHEIESERPLTNYEEKYHEAIIDGLRLSRVRDRRARLRAPLDDRIRSRENRQPRGNHQRFRLGQSSLMD